MSFTDYEGPPPDARKGVGRKVLAQALRRIRRADGETLKRIAPELRKKIVAEIEEALKAARWHDLDLDRTILAPASRTARLARAAFRRAAERVLATHHDLVHAPLARKVLCLTEDQFLVARSRRGGRAKVWRRAFEVRLAAMGVTSSLVRALCAAVEDRVDEEARASMIDLPVGRGAARRRAK